MAVATESKQARRGAGVADIAPERLALLNAGTVEATTLVECLAVDFAQLMGNAVPEAGAAAAERLREAADSGITRRMASAARLIMEAWGAEAIAPLQRHPSDTVRGWACYLIAEVPGMTLEDRLAAIRPLADDAHFGVREWAWMAVRPHLVMALETAIIRLTEWAGDGSERIRRFASESTRPRGVWCSHIAALRQNPAAALPILEPTRADPSRYVQDSVANWLNDASKDHPDWVRAVCARWQAESPAESTSYICRRALRSLDGSKGKSKKTGA